MWRKLGMWLQTQFDISRGHAGSNMLAMEGIRGFAVFLVFIVHYASLVEPWIAKNLQAMDVKYALHNMGNSGVDLFFVLSGYLIYGTLVTREQGFLPFMWRRIRRIYPAFIVVFAIYLALSMLFPKESKIPADSPLSYLLFNFLLLPGMVDIKPMITVAWSLSYEMFYYLVMPAVVALLGLRHWRIEARIALVAVASIVASLLFTMYGGERYRLVMFMAGILLFDALRSKQVRAPMDAVALVALVAGLALNMLPMSGYVKMGALFAAFYLFCACCFVRSDGFLARAMSWTPLRWLGNMSYSYYLVHGLGLKFGFMLFAKMMPPSDHGLGLFLALLPPMFVLTLLPSALLFLCIERPLSLATEGKRKPAAAATDRRPAAVDFERQVGQD